VGPGVAGLAQTCGVDHEAHGREQKEHSRKDRPMKPATGGHLREQPQKEHGDGDPCHMDQLLNVTMA
jgi:hypothetical protein